MKKFLTLFIVLILLSFENLSAQQKKPFTLDDIQNGLFKTESVNGLNWMNDGQYYTDVIKGNIIKYEVKNGVEVEVIAKGSDIISTETNKPIEFDNYKFSKDETKILFSAETEHIYRHSTKSIYYVYDIKSKKLHRLSKGKQSYATFSPDGSKIAFCRDNNLFFINLEDKAEKQITQDGELNKIINGSTDWVYE